MQDKIAVLIPCYNESQTIADVINAFKSALPEAAIYVYDNNSSDGSDKIAISKGALVKYERKQGKGNVIKSMFSDISAECYILVDGDNTYPAEIAPKMAGLVFDGIDMVIGDRISTTYSKENKRPFHYFGNSIVRVFVNKLFNGDIKDIMTGYRAFSQKFVKTFPVLSRGFEVETEMTIHALSRNLTVQAIPIDYRDRPKGSISKLNTITDGRKVLLTIFNLFRYYKPLPFFTLFMTVFLLISICMITPVLVIYFETGLVPNFPTFIAGCVFALFAVLSLICGLILDSVTRIDRQNYELQVQLINYIIRKNG